MKCSNDDNTAIAESTNPRASKIYYCSECLPEDYQTRQIAFLKDERTESGTKKEVVEEEPKTTSKKSGKKQKEDEQDADPEQS